MATKAAYRRLTKEFQAITKSPPPFLRAKPREDNILEWHYILQGPPDTPYEGGFYHGTITFPPDYPYKPPAIRMSTPNGRFAPDKRICLSISDFHPATWNPSWSVATILNGLLSFMVTDEVSAGTVRATLMERRRLASVSHEFNLTSRMFKELFPEYCGNEPIRIDNGQADISIARKAAHAANLLASPAASAPQKRLRQAQTTSGSSTITRTSQEISKKGGSSDIVGLKARGGIWNYVRSHSKGLICLVLVFFYFFIARLASRAQVQVGTGL